MRYQMNSHADPSQSKGDGLREVTCYGHGRTCDEVHGRTYGKVHGRTCDEVHGRTYGKVHGRTCDEVLLDNSTAVSINSVDSSIRFVRPFPQTDDAIQH